MRFLVASRANTANDLPDATTSQPHRPDTHIQVGSSGFYAPPKLCRRDIGSFESRCEVIDLPALDGVGVQHQMPGLVRFVVNASLIGNIKDDALVAGAG